VTGKTIVYLPNWLGDMVMAVPFLHSLRQATNGDLWALGKSSAMHLYNGLGLFNRFIPQDDKDVIGFLDRVSNVKNMKFARSVILPHSFRSALLFFLASVDERIGYARNRRGFMLTEKVEEEKRVIDSTVEHYLRILDKLRIERSIETPILKVTDHEEQRFDEKYLNIFGDYVVFIVGAQYGPAKRWPDTYFSTLADMITSTFPVKILMLPGKGEEKVVEEVLKNVKNVDRVFSESMGITDLKVCLSRASAVVSNDTGPRHISSALSVPTVVIMGPMDERYTCYPNGFTHTVSKDVPCRPCNMRRCDKEHECLRGIEPSTVMATVKEVLSERLAHAH
jgi:heptosyltransferase II